MCLKCFEAVQLSYVTEIVVGTGSTGSHGWSNNVHLSVYIQCVNYDWFIYFIK